MTTHGKIPVNIFTLSTQMKYNDVQLKQAKKNVKIIFLKSILNILQTMMMDKKILYDLS